jgi:hypothetical protein
MNDLLRSYRILRLKPGVSLAEVQQAHRDAAWLWHPDRFPQEPHIQEKAQVRTREINAAYQCIRTYLLESEAPKPETAIPGAAAAPSAAATIPTAGGILPLSHPVQAWFLKQAGGLAVGLALAAGLFLSPLIHNYLSVPAPPSSPAAKEMAPVAPDSGAIQGGKAAPPAAAPEGGAIPGGPARPTPPVSKGYFTLGSSQYEVWAVQGPPQHILRNTWKYGLSTVTFKNRRVVSYLNISRNLRVRLTPGVTAAAGRGPVYFTVGSSKDRVLAVQGTPTGVVGNTWKYGESEVNFRGDRVVSYANTGGNLEVKAPSRTRTVRKAQGDFFTLGSSKRRVLAVQGFPTYVWGNTWWYGYSRIIFYGDRVIGFADVSRNLKARVI